MSNLSRSDANLLRFLAIHPGWHISDLLVNHINLSCNHADIAALADRKLIDQRERNVRINPAGRTIIENHPDGVDLGKTS